MKKTYQCIYRSHINSDQEELIQPNQTRRNHFFNQQKEKIVSKKKTSNYLLPKICISSKKNYQSTINRCSSNKNNSIYNNLEEKQNKAGVKGQKEQFFKLEKFKKIYQGEPDIEQIKMKFREKCQQELLRINFKIAEKIKKKCFFDLTLQQISQLYSKQNCPSNKQAEENHKQNQNEGTKFRLIQKEFIEENRSVPMFLMQRLFLKDLSNMNSSGFLTQPPRIYPSRSKKNQAH